MELTNRPLLDNAPDAELFVPDEVLMGRLAQAVAAELNVLLIGEPGSGKTTVLRQLLYTDRDLRPRFVFVNGSSASDVFGLLELVHAEATRTAGRAFPPVDIRPQWSHGLDAEAARLLALVRGLSAHPSMTVVLDGLPSADAAGTLFGRMRDELWQLPHHWLVATTPRDRRALLTPPADAFFDLRLELQPLSDEILAHIVLRRVGDSPAISSTDLHAIVDAGGGNPRRTLALAREVVYDPRTSSRRRNARARREQIAVDLGRGHSMLLAEMEGRPPVSASDSDLLAALGWTRSRATQVLKELERHGVVEGFDGRSDRGGTLRLYRLADPGTKTA